jgi:hypothetical protein
LQQQNLVLLSAFGGFLLATHAFWWQSCLLDTSQHPVSTKRTHWALWSNVSQLHWRSALMYLTSILEVSCPNLKLWWDLSWFFAVLPSDWHDSTLKRMTTIFSHYIWYYTILQFIYSH